MLGNLSASAPAPEGKVPGKGELFARAPARWRLARLEDPVERHLIEHGPSKIGRASCRERV